MEKEIFISEEWMKPTTQFDLIHEIGTIIGPPEPFVMLWELPPGNHRMFSVKSGEFSFSFGFYRESKKAKSKIGYYLQRNGQKLFAPIIHEMPAPGYVSVVVGWGPEDLRLDTIFYGETEILSQTETIGELNITAGEDDSRINFHQLQTRKVIPPASLRDFARKTLLKESQFYSANTSVLADVISMLQAAQVKISSAGQADAFWNVQHSGRKILGREPKKETEIHSTLQSLLSDYCLVHNVSLAREVGASTGSLDFLLEGLLERGERIKVCIEAKLAHAGKNELRKGLTSQLPEYMDSLGADFGIFVVLWYKGRDFDSPSEFLNMKELYEWLSQEQMAAGNSVSRQRIFILDVARKFAPSKPK